MTVVWDYCGKQRIYRAYFGSNYAKNADSRDELKVDSIYIDLTTKRLLYLLAHYKKPIKLLAEDNPKYKWVTADVKAQRNIIEQHNSKY